MLHKILLIVVVVLLPISLLSCNLKELRVRETLSTGIIDETEISRGEDSINQENPFTEGDTTTKIEEANKQYLVTVNGQYVFCSYQNEGSTDRKDIYIYKDSEELNLVSSQYSYAYVDKSKTKEKKYLFGQQEVDIEYVKSFVYENDYSQLNRKYNNYDVYKDADGKMYHMLIENNQLIKYVDNTDVEQDTITKVGQERATEIANAFVMEQIGEAMFNTYTRKEYVPIMFGKYWVSYLKYVHGYATTDEIIVCVNMDGTIASYTGLWVSLYDNILDKVTFETIKSAEDELLNALRSSYLENLQVVSKGIEITDEGELCISFYVTHGSEAQYADVFYLQIVITE